MLLTACGALVDPLSPAPSAGSGAAGGVSSLVVGSGPTTESHVLAELYAQALSAKGVPASTKTDIGPREAYLRALEDGSVSLVGEYTGSLLLSYDKDATATTAAEVAQALPKALPSSLALGKPSRAVDQNTYVVTKRFSQRHGVTSLADLKKLGGSIVLGGPAQLTARAYGPQGLEQIYGASLKQFRPISSSAVRSRELSGGTINVGEFFSTEAAVAGHGYVVLKDPQAMILPQHVVPLMRTELASNPAATSALDAVQSALTTAELAALNKSVDVDQDAVAQVAAGWLTSKGLA